MRKVRDSTHLSVYNIWYCYGHTTTHLIDVCRGKPFTYINACSIWSYLPILSTNQNGHPYTCGIHGCRSVNQIPPFQLFEQLNLRIWPSQHQVCKTSSPHALIAIPMSFQIRVPPFNVAPVKINTTLAAWIRQRTQPFPQTLMPKRLGNVSFVNLVHRTCERTWKPASPYPVRNYISCSSLLTWMYGCTYVRMYVCLYVCLGVGQRTQALATGTQ